MCEAVLFCSFLSVPVEGPCEEALFLSLAERRELPPGGFRSGCDTHAARARIPLPESGVPPARE